MELNVYQSTGNLERYVDKIKSRIENIAHDFYCIGYYLWEVKYYNYYLEGGYNDIYSFSEKELNFKKSSTINFIALVDKYAERSEGSSYPKMWISEKYKSFGYTQLTEMLSLSPNDIESINSDMTIKEIRLKKKELKSIENNIIDVEFQQDHVALVENQTVIPIIQEQRKDILDYLNDRLEVLRKLSKGEKDDSSDRIKYLAAAYEVKLLIDVINEEDEEFFLF